MQTVTSSDQLQTTIKSLIRSGDSVGFVPTMGALHDGHLKLVSKSVAENQLTIVSIFVNPEQFDKKEDLLKYPRQIDADISKLEPVGVDIVFIPSVETMYPSKPLVKMDFGAMAKVMEGRFRKGHFEGVGLIVSKLLHMVQPTVAYFGLKDLQQFILVRRMCEDFSFPVKIEGVETIRESSGLAMSSRNMRLTSEGRSIAANIFQGLSSIKAGVEKRKDIKVLIEETKNFYKTIEGLEIEYLQAVDVENLQDISSYDEINELAVCVAGYVEGVRLIDNLYLRLK